MERERDPLISECKEEFENLFSQIAHILSDEEYEAFCEWAKTESGWM